jgi:hypothetical protein
VTSVVEESLCKSSICFRATADVSVDGIEENTITEGLERATSTTGRRQSAMTSKRLESVHGHPGVLKCTFAIFRSLLPTTQSVNFVERQCNARQWHFSREERGKLQSYPAGKIMHFWISRIRIFLPQTLAREVSTAIYNYNCMIKNDLVRNM